MRSPRRSSTRFRKIHTVTAAFLLTSALGVSCSRPVEPPSVPRGYMASLRLSDRGQQVRFGPFVGYYFRPRTNHSLSRLEFLCFNERYFYTRDRPENSLLYRGSAVLTVLPDANTSIPDRNRINPVFFGAAPTAWLRTRPAPTNEFLHFHSCYSGSGPVLTGYWMRHVAVTNFTYDMGGRIDKHSPMHHTVSTGVDTGFPRIVEFDAGPLFSRNTRR